MESNQLNIQLSAVSDDEFGEYLLQQWRAKLIQDGGADDQMMVLGGKSKTRQLESVCNAIRVFTNEGDETGRTEIVGWFLCGYVGPGKELPEDVIKWLNAKILESIDHNYVRDPLLYVATIQWSFHSSKYVKEQIEATIRQVLSKHPVESMDDWIGEQISQVMRA